MSPPDPHRLAEEMPTPLRVLVLGGGDVGSAVAHRLHEAGWQVLISERSGSAHARRGMAFTDALFDGSAMLAGVEASRQSDIAGILACWAAARSIPIVTLPEGELIAQLRFAVIVEATMRRHVPPDLRSHAPLAIGLGPGHVPGRNCHIAIETQWGEAMGKVLHGEPAAARSGGPRALDGVTRERFVTAGRTGTWRARTMLGERVAAGAVLGELEGEAIRAPIAGTLRGMARDGVRVQCGHRVIEVDPRALPEVHGLGERPRAIAAGVAQALVNIGVRTRSYGDCKFDKSNP
jgi:xanthine dehydrogenase accessory factor